MTFTYILTNDIGKIRLLISDAVAPAHFTDEELQIFLDLNAADVYLAAASALESWAAALTSSFDSERIGDYSYSKKEANNKLMLAARYREDGAAVPILDWAELDLISLPETLEEDE